jgi:hypothetical protein
MRIQSLGGCLLLAASWVGSVSAFIPSIRPSNSVAHRAGIQVRGLPTQNTQAARYVFVCISVCIDCDSMMFIIVLLNMSRILFLSSGGRLCCGPMLEAERQAYRTFFRKRQL